MITFIAVMSILIVILIGFLISMVANVQRVLEAIHFDTVYNTHIEYPPNHAWVYPRHIDSTTKVPNG